MRSSAGRRRRGAPRAAWSCRCRPRRSRAGSRRSAISPRTRSAPTSPKNPAASQLVERERPRARQPDREHRAARRHGRQDGVHPDAVAEPDVDARRRLVDVAVPRRDEPHRELARLAGRQHHARNGSRSRAPIGPHRAVGIHEHVGDRGVRRPAARAPRTRPVSTPPRRRAGARAARATKPSTRRSCAAHARPRHQASGAIGGRARDENGAGKKKRGGAYWGEQAPPRQRWIGGNRGRCTPRLRSDGTECTPKGGPCNRRNPARYAGFRRVKRRVNDPGYGLRPPCPPRSGASAAPVRIGRNDPHIARPPRLGRGSTRG